MLSKKDSKNYMCYNDEDEKKMNYADCVLVEKTYCE